MDWKKEAIKELENYNQRAEAVISIEERIKILEEDICSLKGMSNGVPVMGGGNKQEDRLINNVSERQLLELNLTITKKLLELTQNALSKLEDDEREVLNAFYISAIPNHIQVLCQRLHMEKTFVYKLKDRALRKFTMLMFGIIEI